MCGLSVVCALKLTGANILIRLGVNLASLVAKPVVHPAQDHQTSTKVAHLPAPRLPGRLDYLFSLYHFFMLISLSR